ncbi:MAG: hypothetical protein UZ21_OP11001000362 [Microgenomates bacterium OLB22]|nr:MAG: hypothetical protein UZ21_OP11001000362 [Microgenomates bacterium OLB22]
MTQKSYQHGELHVAIGLTSLASLLLGLVVGTSGILSNGSPRGFFTQAQSCAYRTEILVLKKNRQGQLIAVNDQERFVVENNKGQSIELKRGGKSYDVFNNFIRLTTTDSSDDKKYRAQEKAAVTLISDSLGSRYKITDIFCEQHSGIRGCPEDDQLANQREVPTNTIRDFNVACDVDITYGWIVEDLSRPSPSPSTEPTTIPAPTLATDTDSTGAIESKVFVVRSQDRPSGDLCDITKLERAVNNDLDGAGIEYYLGECRIDLTKDGAKVSDQKKESACDSVTFTSLPAGTYEVNLNKGRPTELLKVCADARREISINREKKTVPIVLWAPPERQCETVTTCANCRQGGGKCVNKISARGGSSVYLCCGQNQSQDKARPTSTPPQKTAICETKGSYCTDSYTELCSDGSLRTCTKYGRCIIGDGIGDGSKCSWENPREDGRRSICTPCPSDASRSEPLATGKLHLELKNATDRTITIEATIEGCKQDSSETPRECVKKLELPSQGKVSATFEDLVSAMTHTLKVKTSPQTPIKVLRCLNGSVLQAGTENEECSFTTVAGALASLELYIKSDKPSESLLSPRRHPRAIVPESFSSHSS